MNGLDLTEWIARDKGTWTASIILIALVVAFLVSTLVVNAVRSKSEDETTRERLVIPCFMTSALCLLCGVSLLGVTIYRSTALSQDAFARYVTEPYGFVDVDCDPFPRDYLNGTVDDVTCMAIRNHQDMSTLDSTRMFVNIVIRDGHAYLYGEDYNLMEAQN